jgi:hypothetical protein
MGNLVLDVVSDAPTVCSYGTSTDCYRSFNTLPSPGYDISHSLVT